MGQYQIIKDCSFGKNPTVWNFVNLYGARFGDDVKIGSFVEIQSEVSVGHRCSIQSHSFICSLVTIEDDVFVGHGVMFINDVAPPSGTRSKWKHTHIGTGVSIGSNATIMPVKIGAHALIGAGAVVTKDVPDYAVVAGNPARVLKYRDQVSGVRGQGSGEKL